MIKNENLILNYQILLNFKFSLKLSKINKHQLNFILLFYNLISFFYILVLFIHIQPHLFIFKFYLIIKLFNNRDFTIYFQ